MQYRTTYAAIPEKSKIQLDNDLIGDCIGMESCSDLSTNGGGGDLEHHRNISSQHDQQYRQGLIPRPRSTTGKKEFPPVLSILSQTEQSLWVLRRYHTDDGRLILREERAPSQGYFEASRSDGRLRLQLFLVEDEEEEEEEDEQEEEEENDEGRALMEIEKEIREGGGVGSGRRCIDYNTPSFFKMPVLPIRTVHI